MDMHKLYNETYYMKKDNDPRSVEYRPGGMHEQCDKARNLTLANGVSYGLGGDLALEETIDSGLRAMDSVRAYPAAPSGAKSGQSASSASLSQSGSGTGFSAKLDFQVLWGLNGGPSWTLLGFKGPGGGGAASGGGGSLGSGTNGGQLLSYSRTKLDTLISTFSATCKTDDVIPITNATVTMSASTGMPPTSHFDISMPDLSEMGASYSKFKLTLSADLQHGDHATTIQQAVGTVQLRDRRGPRQSEGIVTWSGFYFTGPDPSSSWRYLLRGTITDPQAGTMLGTVYLTMIGSKDNVLTPRITNIKISRNAIDTLQNQGAMEPSDYWSSLPSCAAAGPFSSSGLNILQQLSSPTGNTLLQNNQ